MYKNKFNENLSLIHVDNRTKLVVNVALENERLARMHNLLMVHAVYGVQAPFNYTKYEAKSMEDRCYDAAVETAKRYGLYYVEGVVVISDVGLNQTPYAHGWCMDRRGLIVDPVLHQHQHKWQFNYVGVPFKLDYVEEQYRRSGYYGLLDGRHDGAEEGVYFDPPARWLLRFD